MQQGAPVLVDGARAGVVAGMRALPTDSEFVVSAPGFTEAFRRDRFELLPPDEAEAMGLHVRFGKIPEQCRGFAVIPHKPVRLLAFFMGVAQLPVAMCHVCGAYFVQQEGGEA